MSELITNGSEIKNRIISEIGKAKKNVFLAMAWFTDRDIASAFIEAKSRDVNVEVILSSNEQNDAVKNLLVESNILVHAFETGDSRGIMHHKFLLIDDNISINGSYNYSYNASKNNIENIYVSYDYKTYSKFLEEFERLRYNIDHRIELNQTNNSTDSTKELNNKNAMQNNNMYDTFSDQLNNLVYSAIDLDTDKYSEKGYENSKESFGNLDIFRIEYNNIKEKIRTYATDEGLGSKKNLLLSNITLAFESTKTSLSQERDSKIEAEKCNNDLAKHNINTKVEELKAKKSLLESGNHEILERGLLQVNKEIEKNKLEKTSLEQTVILKKFWNIGTVLAILGLVIFVFYLSVFFASAVYKAFFEANDIRAAMEQGVDVKVPPIVDANAILNMFTNHGVMFGLIGMLFFLVPVLISNFHIFGNSKKWLNTMMFIIGIVLFDIIVSVVITMTTAEVKATVMGEPFDFKIWEAPLHGEFWLIFAFGMFPLIVMHKLIDFLIDSYNKSQMEIVDAKINSKVLFLNNKLIELEFEKNSLINKIEELNTKLDELYLELKQLDLFITNLKIIIDSNYADYQKNIKNIFEDYQARISSGKIFTEMILDSVISAYKSGFVEFLPEYYAPDEVAKRVREIEQSTLRIAA